MTSAPQEKFRGVPQCTSPGESGFDGFSEVGPGDTWLLAEFLYGAAVLQRELPMCSLGGAGDRTQHLTCAGQVLYP